MASSPADTAFCNRVLGSRDEQPDQQDDQQGCKHGIRLLRGDLQDDLRVRPPGGFRQGSRWRLATSRDSA